MRLSLPLFLKRLALLAVLPEIASLEIFASIVCTAGLP